MNRAQRVATAAMAVGILTAGCSDDEPVEPAETTEQTSAPKTTGEDPTNPGPTTDGEGAAETIEGTIDVDREVIHPNNTVISVTKITAEENAVYIDIEAYNGGEREVTLISTSVEPKLWLDGERQLTFRELEDSKRLNLPEGAELTATLAFAGRIPAGSETLDLRINWEDVFPPDLEFDTSRPTFEFEGLPVPAGAS